MNFVFTFPKKISEYLFDDPAGKEKIAAIHNLCWKRILEDNVLNIYSKDHKTTEKLQLGIYSNLHDWSSSNPSKPHEHLHDNIPNFLYDKIRKEFIRIHPYLSKLQREKIQLIWYESQAAILSYGKNNGSIYSEFDIDPKSVDFFYQYLKGYREDIEKPEDNYNKFDPLAIRKYKEDYKEFKNNERARGRILHSLKYCTRSYLVDLGDYFNYYDTDNDFVRFTIYYPYLKKQFKKFVDHGCIENKTSTKGYLRNLRNIVRDIDSKRNTNLYNQLYDINGKIKKNRSTLHCPVTQEKFTDFKTDLHVFSDIKSLCVYMAHKSGMIKISTFKFKNNIGKK